MMDFIIVTAGVFVGGLAATGAMLLLTCNKKVMKAYTKYLTKMGIEIGEEMADEIMSKDDEGL